MVKKRIEFIYVHKVRKNVSITITPSKDGKGFYEYSDEAMQIADGLLKECINNSNDFDFTSCNAKKINRVIKKIVA